MKFKSEDEMEEAECMCEETVKRPADHLTSSSIVIRVNACCCGKDNKTCGQLEHVQSDEPSVQEKDSSARSDLKRGREDKQKNWRIQVSSFALNSINPIRQTVESLKVQPNASKSFIPLSIGDPNFFGNLLPHPIIARELKRVMDENKSWGYYASSGMECAREAIAQYISVPGAPVTASDIYVTSGGSHALDLCISLLARSTGNILIPRPGFPLYQTLAKAHGVQCKFYNLNPHDGWKIDLKDLTDAIDENTLAIVYNNPSNPCGAVYSVEHMHQLLTIAQDHCVPIIADEIYEGMVFDSINTPFVPIASLTTQVPVLSCRGLTKR